MRVRIATQLTLYRQLISMHSACASSLYWTLGLVMKLWLHSSFGFELHLITTPCGCPCRPLLLSYFCV